MVAIFIGFLGGLVTALIIERLKKPKLRLSIGPISDQVHGDIPMRFLYVRVKNELPTTPIISWFISRIPALRARATIEFLRLDGSSVFARPMTARWSFSNLPPRLAEDNVLHLADLAALNLRDIFCGEYEELDVAMKQGDGNEAFGFNNMSYVNGFTAPEWLLPPDRYIVLVTVAAGDVRACKNFVLRADWPRSDFSLEV